MYRKYKIIEIQLLSHLNIKKDLRKDKWCLREYIKIKPMYNSGSSASAVADMCMDSSGNDQQQQVWQWCKWLQ